MKKDPLSEHKKKVAELQLAFSKKSQYHQQKAYLELKDIYWLCHEFFTSLLTKDRHFTEEELLRELKEFKHEYLTIPSELLTEWQSFFHELSESQYSGKQPSQEKLKAMLTKLSTLIEQTLGSKRLPQTEFSTQLQAAQLLIKNGDAEKAEERYQKLMQQYLIFPPEQKALYYAQLELLYHAIADARSAQPAARQ